MANDLATTGTTALATGGANPWAEAARGVETGTYLKFNGNDGRWSYGQDDEDLPEGTRVITDMETLAFGWICWVESAVEEEKLVPVLEGKPPQEHELTDYGPYDDDDGWREAASLSMILESYGDDDQDEAVGTALLWKTSTGGQVRQIRKLSGAYGRVFSQHPGEFPIVELSEESYVPRNKKHGKIKYSPLLKIVGWMTEAELEGLTGAPAADDDGEDEPAPKAKAKALKDDSKAKAKPRRKAAEPEPEEEDEPEEPAPRRRRKAEPVEEPEEEEDEAPAPRTRRRKAEPVDEPEEEEDEAPAPRTRRRKAEPVDEPEEEEDEAPAPRGRRRKAEPEDDGEDEDEAPAPRGRSAGRSNKRLRTFD